MDNPVVNYISGIAAVVTKLVDFQISCVHLIRISDFPTIWETLLGTFVCDLGILHGIVELG